MLLQINVHVTIFLIVMIPLPNRCINTDNTDYNTDNTEIEKVE